MSGGEDGGDFGGGGSGGGGAKIHLSQLDGMRGPLCIGVIAINMGLYNAGANFPVGVFLVLSGLASFLAYCDNKWDDASTARFFLQRLARLLPMLLISTFFQLCMTTLWLIRRGVTKDPAAGDCGAECTSGGGFSFVVTLWSFILTLAGSGLICHGKICCCCAIDVFPRPPCALLPLVLGSYLNGPGWYVGLLLFVQAYFLPKLLSQYGEEWRAAPPSSLVLLGWASLEALQYALPLLVYLTTSSVEGWFYSTLYIYLGLPPLFRLVTFVFGLQLGRWALFQVTPPKKELGNGGQGGGVPTAALADSSIRYGESSTIVAVLVTGLVVVRLHGFLASEPEMHRPNTGTTAAHWALIHLLHPFNLLGLLCALVRAPRSLVSRLLASRPLALLAKLSYAMYLLQYGVITAYARLLDKDWHTAEWERLQASADATPLDARDYVAVVLLSAALAYPVTYFVEPRIAAWLRARLWPGEQLSGAPAGALV